MLTDGLTGRPNRPAARLGALGHHMRGVLPVVAGTVLVHSKAPCAPQTRWSIMEFRPPRPRHVLV